jgi:hypothetical protein
VIVVIVVMLALVEDPGTIRRPLGLFRRSLHAKPPRWWPGTVSSRASHLNRSNCCLPVGVSL